MTCEEQKQNLLADIWPKRAERESDVSSGAKDPGRIGGDNRVHAEDGEMVSEAEDGLRLV